jgi:hypothetical protein
MFYSRDDPFHISQWRSACKAEQLERNRTHKK